MELFTILVHILEAIITQYVGVMDKNNNLRKWVKFDDESVSYIDESRIITPNSYILFYKAF